MTTMTTLPTIHLNGTGAHTIASEYRAVRLAVQAVVGRLAVATCNARDFYPQGPDAWQQARAERREMFQLLQRIADYAQAWEQQARQHQRP